MSQKRTKQGQTKHDKKVEQRLDSYKKQGATFIRADLPGRANPPKMGGKTPDLYVRLKGKLVVEEVETKKTVDSDKKQQEILRRETKKKGGIFKVSVTK
ncbi:MAG: hypothetical protein WDZ85_01815 [Candidatus Paceibacterota bacterium]